MKKLAKSRAVFKSNGRVFGKQAGSKPRTHRATVGSTDMAVADRNRRLVSTKTDLPLDRLCRAIPKTPKLCRPLPPQSTLYELKDSGSRRKHGDKKKDASRKSKAGDQGPETVNRRRSKTSGPKLSNRKRLIVRTRARRTGLGRTTRRRRGI